VYLFTVIGVWVTPDDPATRDAYGFLTWADPAVAAPIASLANHEADEAVQQLENLQSAETKSSWVYHCAMGLARWSSGDNTRAEQAFRAALDMRPPGSQCYYHYGRLLLELESPTAAVDMFQQAQQRAPRIEGLPNQIALAQDAYLPPRFVAISSYILILLISFTLHECAHAYAARQLGDDTAFKAGRVTLNPFAHLELFGSIVLPAILLARGSEAVFGWARPVPVDPSKFKRPVKDDMIVSLAGPGTNLAVAALAMLLFMLAALVVRIVSPTAVSSQLGAPGGAMSLAAPGLGRWSVYAFSFLKDLILTSLVLGFFNLLPIPPLDGSRVLAGLLPRKSRRALEGFGKFGGVLMLLLFVTPVAQYVLMVPIVASWLPLTFYLGALGFH
jgi:Zn-dependent protease